MADNTAERFATLIETIATSGEVSHMGSFPTPNVQMYGLKLKDKHMPRLCSALARNTNLTALSVGHNEIGDEGLRQLCAVVATHPTLTMLSIAANNITDVGISHLCTCLAENHNIVTLWMEQIRITDDGAEELCEVLRDRPHLKTINIGQNKRLTERGHRALATVQAAFPDAGVRCDAAKFAEYVKEFNEFLPPK
eukprot:m.457082 g.457082  ORF g.457082 m.457082 type:complete len:195 (-) comp20329_c4_seq1:82-666(-)